MAYKCVDPPAGITVKMTGTFSAKWDFVQTGNGLGSALQVRPRTDNGGSTYISMKKEADPVDDAGSCNYKTLQTYMGGTGLIEALEKIWAPFPGSSVAAGSIK